ncbi:MAG: BrnA antitoxin family protein [Paracoccaceae bacterium]
MSGLRRQTPKQRMLTSYMAEVMERLEWDLHNTIELTGRIPEEWHEIAKARPLAPQVKVNLRLEADVVRFFKSMGEGYGSRINDVLKSYMYARLTGLLRGAETVCHFRTREVHHAGAKPAFSDEPPVARGDTGRMRAKMQERMQQTYAADGLTPDVHPGQFVR